MVSNVCHMYSLRHISYPILPLSIFMDNYKVIAEFCFCHLYSRLSTIIPYCLLQVKDGLVVEFNDEILCCFFFRKRYEHFHLNWEFDLISYQILKDLTLTHACCTAVLRRSEKTSRSLLELKKLVVSVQPPPCLVPHIRVILLTLVPCLTI